jgi:tetratricopeptide (TPR) repeat protein
MRRAWLVVLLAMGMVVPCVANAQSRPERLSDVASVDIEEAMLMERSTAPERWRLLGTELYAAGRYRQSIASFERALQLCSTMTSADAWNIARGYAKLGNSKQALRWLTHARQAGYRDDLALREEPAFKQFHADPRFRALMLPSSCKQCSLPLTLTLTLL